MRATRGCLSILIGFLALGIASVAKAAPFRVVDPNGGEIVAIIDDSGDMTIGGDLYTSQSAITAPSGDYQMRTTGPNAEIVMRIVVGEIDTPSQGELPQGALLLAGQLYEEELPTTQTLIFKVYAPDPGNPGHNRLVAAVTDEGDLFLLGTLTVDPEMVGGEIISHRIATRIDPERGTEFYDTVTDDLFSPDGITFTRLYRKYAWDVDQGKYVNSPGMRHRAFAAGVDSVGNPYYDIPAIEDMFTSMVQRGFNLVRIILDAPGLGGLDDPLPEGQQFVPETIDNMADFLKRARRHGIYVYIVPTFLAASYPSLHTGPSFGFGTNTWFLWKVRSGPDEYAVNTSFAEVYAGYVGDLIEALIRSSHDPSLANTFFGICLWGELVVFDDQEPFSTTTTLKIYLDDENTSPTAPGYNASTDEINPNLDPHGDADDRRNAAFKVLNTWVERVSDTVKSRLETSDYSEFTSGTLLSEGTSRDIMRYRQHRNGVNADEYDNLYNYDYNPLDPDDPETGPEFLGRYTGRMKDWEAIESLDFLDLNVYINDENSTYPCQILESVYQLDELTSKPLIMGEYGAQYLSVNGCISSGSSPQMRYHGTEGFEPPEVPEGFTLAEVELTTPPLYFEHSEDACPTGNEEDPDCIEIIPDCDYDVWPLSEAVLALNCFRDAAAQHYDGISYWSWGFGVPPDAKAPGSTPQCCASYWAVIADDETTTTRILNHLRDPGEDCLEGCEEE